MSPDNDDSGDDEDDPWRQAIRDVTPLGGESAPQPAGPAARRRIQPAGRRPTVRPAAAPAAPRMNNAPSPGLDRRTEERFRRGRMKIEGTIDLHGMRQEEARAALTRFVLAAHGSGKRCVLVITGKGCDDRGHGEHWLDPAPPGALRRNVPLWLQSDALAPIVLRHAAALPRDGGEGALYLLLRRKREN